MYSNRRGSREIEHIGSAHYEARLELLKAAARQRLAAGQGKLNLGAAASASRGARGGGPLPITSSRMGHLWDALSTAFKVLGFDAACDNDDVFRQLVLARIIEPTSKVDAARVLEEVGIAAASYATVKRRLSVYATEAWRATLAKACASRSRVCGERLFEQTLTARERVLGPDHPDTPPLPQQPRCGARCRRGGGIGPR